MKKEFDETTLNQYKELYSYLNQTKQEVNEASNLVKENVDSIAILSNAPLWSHLYELPFRAFLAICILEFNASSTVKKIVQSDNIIQGLLISYSEINNLLSQEKKLSDKDASIRFSLYMAIQNQFLSMAVNGAPLSSLVEKAREGNNTALLDAVMIDKTIVSTPSIAHRIQLAQLSGNDEFLDDLSKAIRISKPRRRRPTEFYDDLRYLLLIVKEQIGFNNVNNKDLLKLLSDDLELYPKGKDIGNLRGFEMFIQRFEEKYST